MEEKRAITINDYNRLIGLIEFASAKAKMPESVSNLYGALKSAKMFHQKKISVNVITMNSRVVLKDISNRREAEVTITYPSDANPSERRISVFSTIGIALIGKQVGDVVSWKTPEGMGRFAILKINYQPEAVGDYSL